MFRKVKKVHFVGIGGIGMSGIAELLMNLGFEVSGSDLKSSKIIQNLKEKGATIREGDDSTNLNDSDVLVYSSSVKEDNPEIIEANKKALKAGFYFGDTIEAIKTTYKIRHSTTIRYDTNNNKTAVR